MRNLNSFLLEVSEYPTISPDFPSFTSLFESLRGATTSSPYLRMHTSSIPSHTHMPMLLLIGIRHRKSFREIQRRKLLGDQGGQRGWRKTPLGPCSPEQRSGVSIDLFLKTVTSRKCQAIVELEFAGSSRHRTARRTDRGSGGLEGRRKWNFRTDWSRALCAARFR